MNAYLKALVMTCGLIGSTSASSAESTRLVTIVTSPNAQTQLMAMVLSMQSAQQGANVHILLCGPAGDLALKKAPESALAPQKPKGMSPQGLMTTILQKTDTTAEVCAIYLPNAGLDATALVDGVAAADPREMSARLLEDGVRILSF